SYVISFPNNPTPEPFHSFPNRPPSVPGATPRSPGGRDVRSAPGLTPRNGGYPPRSPKRLRATSRSLRYRFTIAPPKRVSRIDARSEEHTSELQSPYDLVCRRLPEQQKP